jgi:hypothetical protein
MSNLIYAKIIAPSIKSLSVEVMVIGVFVVGLSYIRCVMIDKKILKKGYLWRQILLLLSVVLFCMYCIISYNCETLRHIPREKNDILLPIKLFFYIMPILDLSIIGLIGVMFGCLAIEPSLMDKDDYESSKEELSSLLALSSVNHFVCILWWLVWIGSDTFELRNINFHSFMTLIYLALFLTWRSLVRHSSYARYKEVYEWCGAAGYALIAVIVYLIRMSYYFDSILKSQIGS